MLNSDPVGGPPSISGTVRVRQELTADTTGITDADGPATLPFEYQWRRANNAAGTAGAEDISGETSSTYTLTPTDLGKYIQVVVSYTDGGGVDESLQSAWVGAVGEAQPPPTRPRRAP